MEARLQLVRFLAKEALILAFRRAASKRPRRRKGWSAKKTTQDVTRSPRREGCGDASVVGPRGGRTVPAGAGHGSSGRTSDGTSHRCDTLAVGAGSKSASDRSKPAAVQRTERLRTRRRRSSHPLPSPHALRPRRRGPSERVEPSAQRPRLPRRAPEARLAIRRRAKVPRHRCLPEEPFSSSHPGRLSHRLLAWPLPLRPFPRPLSLRRLSSQLPLGPSLPLLSWLFPRR